MMWRLGLMVAVCLLAGGWSSPRAETDDNASIVYLSRTTVYVDKGETDGVVVGAELTIHRDGQQIGRIMVDFVAEHSASCHIVTSDEPLAVGDLARFTPVVLTAEEPSQEPDLQERYRLEQESGAAKQLTLPRREERSRLSGRAALELEYFADAGDTDQDFRQPSLYLRLDGHRLGQKPIHMQLRLRSKYTQRSRAIDEERPETEWLHRLYQLNLAYYEPGKPIRLEIGRLYARDLRGAGNWDGGLLEVRLGQRLRIGALGGGMPDLTSSEPDIDQQQWGGYLTYVAGQRGNGTYRGTVGVVGQYSSGEVSREFAVLANEVSLGQRLGFYQNLELDLNRDWREEAAGESRTLSRFNAMARYKASSILSFNLGYDYYQNVRRAETQDIPDSLFADTALRGLRLGTRVRLASNLRLGGRIGYRDRDDEDKRPVYANADLGWGDWLGTGADLQLHYAYADGRYSESHVPSVDVQRQFGRAVRLGLGLGSQSYDGLDPESLSVEGQWFRLYGTYLVTRRADLQWIYSHASGDIAPGSRVLLRLGYRL